MAGRGPRTGDAHDTARQVPQPPDRSRHARGRRGRDTGEPADEPRGEPTWGGEAEASLVRIHDLAGRPRGTGFVADHHGTVLTSHEAVDGLARLVLHATGDRGCVVTADAVTPLPGLDLALVRTEGLGVDPLPVTVRDRVAAGTYVRLPAGRWREARVLDAASVTYTATDRFHLLDDVLELAIGTAGRDALRLGGGAAGGPVLDAATGAVVAVLGTALRSSHQDIGFAVPLRPAPPGPLADLLADNAATVPAYGADLNLAGVLELTATSVGQDGPAGALAGSVGRVDAVGPDAGVPGAGEPVERAEVLAEFAAFLSGAAPVLGLVGEPGSGRTTELAGLAARRHRGAEPAPTLWLRGADLRDQDDSLADAAHRALNRASRIVAASRTALPDAPGDLTPDRIAHVAHTAGRPLLLLLDSPEEMPPVLAHRLPEWTDGTAKWLRETGARLVVACRAEYWEEAGAGFPDGALHVPAVTAPGLGGAGSGEDVDGGLGDGCGEGPGGGLGDGRGEGLGGRRGEGFGGGRGDGLGDSRGDSPGDCPGDGPGALRAGQPLGDRPRRPLPPCVPLGDLREDEARRARARYRLPEGVLTGPDARHPLTLRLLSEVCAALPHPPPAPVDRHDVLSGYLDLLCLRVAVRLAEQNGLRGRAVRRLAARVCGQVHEAARRSLGPGQGGLDRESFEAVFPWGPAPARLGGGTGWASAVLTEGLLVPAGAGYRFAHEELADWIQGIHLDLDEALRVLVHPRPAPHPLPVPHHRIGPVVQALLLLTRHHGSDRLSRRLEELAHALDTDRHSWWAARLLAEVLRRLPDASPYTSVLDLLADRIVAWRQREHPVPAELGPDFWAALALPTDTRCRLLRRLVLADGPPHEPGPRFLDAVARLLTAEPTAVQPHLVRWFDDERPLPATPDATVAEAAQALLHTHRHRALDDLTEALVAGAHRHADELLAVLAEDEPSAICRAVDRWAHDERPARRVAAVAYAQRAAPHVRTEADRELLRYAALALLARPADCTLHGGALALLVRDPSTRTRHLPQALGHFVAGDPHLPPAALVPALATHPDPVLDAFRARLRRPDPGDTLRTLAEVTTAPLARRVAALVREAVERRPETAVHVAGYLDRRLDQGPTARTVLLPLVTGLLDGGPEQVRAALATVLAAPGTPHSRPLRAELLELLLAREHEPSVLIAVLHAAAPRDDDPLAARGLVHRTGLLLVRTPDGAARFDRGLVDLGRHLPGFAARLAGWLADTPEEWAAVVGPSARRMIENLAGVRVPA